MDFIVHAASFDASHIGFRSSQKMRTARSLPSRCRKELHDDVEQVHHEYEPQQQQELLKQEQRLQEMVQLQEQVQQ